MPRSSSPQPPGSPGRCLLSLPQGRCALGGRRPLPRPQGRRVPKGPWRVGLARGPPLRRWQQAGRRWTIEGVGASTAASVG
jgi:hypothetical protein